MHEHGLTLDSAINLVRRQRNKINPNAGFMKQLMSFERKIKNARLEKRMQQYTDKLTYLDAAEPS